MSHARGRPLGATSRPQFHTYTTEEDRVEYVQWVREHYHKDMKLAVWYGDQLFGKAIQPQEHSGVDGSPITVDIVSLAAKVYGGGE